MKALPLFILSATLLWLAACSSEEKKEAPPAKFCNAACDGDTILLRDSQINNARVRITMDDCSADSITWGSSKMKTYRQLPFDDVAGKTISVSPDHVLASFFEDYVWVTLTACDNRQSFVFKLPFNEKDNIIRKNNVFGSTDPSYRVNESLIAYTDRGNIFVEDKKTGKQAMMTFGVQTDMDYTAMHETVDTVNITPTRIWARVKIEGEWKEKEKAITLE